MRKETNSESKKHEWQVFAKEMVIQQIQQRGITNTTILKVFEETPRHLFVPKNLEKLAYIDGPLPIGKSQTISQPYIVALMTNLLQLKGDETILEIGTGSGYQTAILSTLANKVYTIECLKNLADTATLRLKELNYDNVSVKLGNGYLGWPQYAPFDRIIVTAAPDKVPETLIDQLKIGGIMVIPVGTHHQELKEIKKNTNNEIEEKSIIPVRFVSMVDPKDIIGST